jgi:hypothetical protein
MCILKSQDRQKREGVSVYFSITEAVVLSFDSALAL